MERLKLIEALSKIRSGLAQKEVIEQSTSFIFTKTNISTYNDEISITYPFKTKINGVIRAEMFFSYLNKNKDESIELNIEENELCVIGEKSKAGFKLEKEISLPLPEIETEGWKKLPEGFIDAIKLCLFTISKDLSRPILTCVHINSKQIESSDNMRVTKTELKSNIKNMLIPNKAAVELVKYPIIEYLQKDNWLRFKTKEDLVFSCRTYPDNFPDTSKVWECKGEKIKLSLNMKEVIERAAIFTKQESKLDEEIELIMDENKMQIKAIGDHGWFKEEIRVKRTSKDEKHIKVNPGFLIEAIERLRDCTIGDVSALFEGENIQHIIRLK